MSDRTRQGWVGESRRRLESTRDARCLLVAEGERELSAFLNLGPIGCADFQDNAKRAREREILWGSRARASSRSILVPLRVRVW